MAGMRFLVIKGLPREGKSYEGLRMLSEADSGIYLSAKHEIVDQSFKRFACPAFKTAVKMEGKFRLCNTGKRNCSTCPMKPDEDDPDHIGYFEQMHLSQSLLSAHQKLSSDDVKLVETDSILKKYGGLCRYYTLKLAMERCDFVFTVPQIHVPKENVDLLVVDEDPTLSYYFPQPMGICSFMHLPNDTSDHIDIPDFQFIVDEINQKGRKVSSDRDILKAISTLNAVRDTLVLFKDKKIERHKVIETLDKIPVPVFEDRDTAYRAISKRLIGDERSIAFDAVFYPAPIRFYLETGRYTNTVFAIADSEHQVREFPPSKRTLFIGATMAEKIAMTCAPGACRAIEFKSFRFVNNFAIIPVKEVSEVWNNGKKYERVCREKTQQFLLAIAENLTRYNIPSIIITGSKQVQRKVEADLRNMDVPSLVSQQETRDELDDNVLTGRPTIIVANGSVSRGIDLDIFDVTIFYNSDFSTPYWSAMEQYWKGKDDEKSWQYGYIREEILIDETVNLAFRMAPVKGVWEKYPKVLFIPVYYLERIRARCAELGVSDIFEGAISKHTLTMQNVDVKILGAEIGAQFRSVTKIREKGEKIPKSDSDYSDEYELSYICNQYPDLPQNAPILVAVREGRLVEFLVGLMLKDTERFAYSDDVPAYLEHIIRLLVMECIRTITSASKDGVSTMDIITFVQFPPQQWIVNHPDVVIPDARDSIGRPQKFLATRDQVRKVLKRMNADGTLGKKKKGRTDMWSLSSVGSVHTDTRVHNISSS